MPRYFFDITEDGTSDLDEVGLDLPDLEAAVDEAHMRLAEMAPRPEGQMETISVRVREGSKVRTSIAAPLTPPFSLVLPSSVTFPR